MRITHPTKGTISTKDIVYLEQLNIAFKDVITVNESKLIKVDSIIDELTSKYNVALDVIERHPMLFTPNYSQIVELLKTMRLATAFPYDGRSHLIHRYKRVIMQNNVNMGLEP